MAKLSYEKGIVPIDYSENIKSILTSYGLPYEVKLEDNEEIINIVALDKKNMGSTLKIIIMKEIGNAEIYNTTIDFFK